MISIFATLKRPAVFILGAALCLLAGPFGSSAQAQARLRAHYTISMTGVSIGQIVWLVAIGDARYVIAIPDMAAIPATLLKKPVANLEEYRYEIIAALDLVFTGV